MSIALMTAVWKLDLQPSDKMVLLALSDAANDDGVTWMAVKSRAAGKVDLLTKCSLSERAVQGAIKRLCEAGLLSRHERPGKGVIYTVTPAASAPPQHLRPAANDTDPRSICGETVSKPQPTSEAIASSVAREGRGTRRCPPDWTPSPADISVAEGEGLPPGAIDRELAKFRDHTFGTARADWSATFRNWIRRTAERKPHDRPDRSAKLDHLAAVFGAMGLADEPEPDHRGNPRDAFVEGRVRELPSAA